MSTAHNHQAGPVTPVVAATAIVLVAAPFALSVYHRLP